MVRKILILCITCTAAAWAWQGELGTSGEALAQAPNPFQNSPGLFYNFYVPPVCPPTDVGAELYPCPRPVPPSVGHTYITYEPLMPHEFLYRHSRSYWRYNPGAGWTRARVSWR